MSLNSVAQLARLSVSLPAELLAQLDEMVQARGLASRSQMIAELIRHELAEHNEGTVGAILSGTITLIYRAESGWVRQALAQTQSEYLKEVISSQHVFLEDDQSLEVLLVQGPARKLQAIANEMISCRGVISGKMNLIAALIPPIHPFKKSRKKK